MTFDEWWRKTAFTPNIRSANDFAQAGWEACEAALRRERDEAVAGAYLAAAKCLPGCDSGIICRTMNPKISSYCSTCRVMNKIIALTTADAQAALAARDADRDALIEDLKLIRSQKDETIKRLEAELKQTTTERDQEQLAHQEIATKEGV